MTPSPFPQTSYVSARTRGRTAKILLIAGAICSALLILDEVCQLMFPSYTYTEGQELSFNQGGMFAVLLYSVLTLLGILIFIATAVVFLMWLHRSVSNLTSFGYWKSQGYSPAWSVGSFFVPIVNLFVPYQAVKQLWQNSRPADSQSFSFSSSPPGFFPAWWGFWLASNFATNIHFRMSGRNASHEATVIVGIVSEVLSIAAAGFALAVIKEIDRRQEETLQHLTPTDRFPVPPPPPVFDPIGKQTSQSQATPNEPVSG